MRRFIALVLLAGVGVGCDSLRGPHAEYTMPAVSGRVLEAGTSHPLAGARVVRFAGRPPTANPYIEKGGEAMIADPPIMTDGDGTFYIPARKAAFLVLGTSGTLEVGLQVSHRNYLTLTTNYDLVKIRAVPTPKGPELKAGDLLLQREP
jgi:hypothetical protein